VLKWLWAFCPGETAGFVRSQLGLVLFSGDEVEKKVPSLSGGEAARLILARLAVEQPNVLVLDEPTNHLDLEAIESLAKALEAYEGTLIFVSHDRWVVSRLASRILEITPEGLQDFPGTYEEYLAHCGDDHLDAEYASLRARREKKRDRKTYKEERRRQNREAAREKRLEELRAVSRRTMAEIESAEARVAEIDRAFCEPGFFESTSREDVSQMEAEQAELRRRLERLHEEWGKVEEELAGLEASGEAEEG
jgi:ABC-type multidrug transport system ATPase subunit